MRVMSTRVHAILDYLVASWLIATPWLMHFSYILLPTSTLIGAGIAIIIYSLLTNYEFGIAKIMPIRLHLGLDFFIGILLIVSPWLFQFSDIIWKPHLLFGLVSIIASSITKTSTTAENILQNRLRRKIERSL